MADNDNDLVASEPWRLHGMTREEYVREMAMARAMMTPELEKAVADFTRVCEQTGLIEQLRKE